MTCFTWMLVPIAFAGILLYFFKPRGVTVDDNPLLPLYEVLMAFWAISFLTVSVISKWGLDILAVSTWLKVILQVEGHIEIVNNAWSLNEWRMHQAWGTEALVSSVAQRDYRTIATCPGQDASPSQVTPQHFVRPWLKVCQYQCLKRGTVWSWSGLEPGLLNPESSTLTITAPSLTLLILFIFLYLRYGKERNQNTHSCGEHTVWKTQNCCVLSSLVKYVLALSLENLRSIFPDGKDGCVTA